MSQQELIKRITERIEELKADFGWVGIRSSGESDETIYTRSTDWRDDEESDCCGLCTTNAEHDWSESHILHEKRDDMFTPQYHGKYVYIVAGETIEDGEDHFEIIIDPMLVERMN